MADGERIALVTGFEPYGGRSLNPALEVARRLDGISVGGVRILGRPLPVSFEALRQSIDALLDSLNPAVVIALGLAAGTPLIRLERVGVNIADFEIPDNDGAVVADAAIDANAATALKATLPLRRIEQALLAAGIPVQVSNSAGTFLCNAALYTMLHRLAAQGRAVPCGFMHLPYMPAQVVDLLQRQRSERRLERSQRADLASMDIEVTTAAVRIALEVSLAGA